MTTFLSPSNKLIYVSCVEAGLVPMQMADGQVRLVRPPGMLPTLPPGLNPPQQLPPGMAPAGHGLVQLPPGLVPLRPIMPVCDVRC